jgi:tetratricopeptide (TPR) repeat protein
LRICVLLAFAIVASTAMAQEDTANSWSDKGYAFLFEFKYEDALKAFDQAISIDPQHVAAWIGRGSSLDHLGNYSEALEAYNRTIEIAPYNPRAWVGRGLALEDLNKSDEALEAYQKAIEIDPEYAIVWNDKAWLRLKMGNYDQAVEDANRAIEILDRGLAQTLDTKGVALAGLGEYEQAIECFDRAIELEPSIAEIWFHKGDALKGLGREDDAEAAYAIARNSTLVWPGGEDI